MSKRCPKCGSPKNEHRNLICGNAVRPDGSAYRTSLCDYIAALRAENDQWMATYNDLIGRVPRGVLDDINRGKNPHVCEFRAEFDAMRAERDRYREERIRRRRGEGR